MTHGELLALLPYLILAATSVVVMLGIAVRRSHAATVALTLVGLAAAVVTLRSAAGDHGHLVTALLVVNGFSVLYLALILLAAIAVTLFAADYLERQTLRREEFYVLLLTATLGAGVLVASWHFASVFLSLEILSVSLYGLVSYQCERPLNLEAGVKYLVLAGTSSAFLLFGMALLYSQTGDLMLHGAGADGGLAAANSPVYLIGELMLLVGIGFKLGVVPFHMWTPDIYQGAPAPVGAFIATVSKGAVFAVLLHCFVVPDLADYPGLRAVFATVAVLSMLGGSLLALQQTNVKRLLGYSSIAHMGYLLVALIAGGLQALGIGTFYLVAYFITMLGAFGVVSVLSSGERDAEEINDYTGLAWRRPWLAAVFTAMLLSLAGIPLTAGFMAKVYLLAGGASRGEWGLLLVLAVASAIGLFYYLRVVVAIFRRAPAAAPHAVTARPGRQLLSGLALAVLLVLLVWLGVYPGPLMARCWLP
jgi:NADH-quinone oxidoreductase subunit N